MECEAVGRRRARHTVAVTLLLCTLVPRFTCLSLQGLSKAVKEDEGGNEAPAIDVKAGSNGFNGKALNFQSGSDSAPGNELLHVDLYPSDSTEMFELEKDFSTKAEWRRLTSSLHCGLDKMKLMFPGLGASDLQVDMGNAPPLPLTHMLETCGYLMQQNELGLELTVPYDGCNVNQENGQYVLQMRWRETPVKFACPMLPSPDSTPSSTASESLQQPWKVPFSPRSKSLRRSKRHIIWPPIYDTDYPSYYTFPYYIYLAEFSNPYTPVPPPYYLYNPYYINSHNYPYQPVSPTPPTYINSHNSPYRPVLSRTTPPPYNNSHNYPYKPVSSTPPPYINSHNYPYKPVSSTPPPYINSHNYPYKPVSSTPPPYINSHNYPYKPVSSTPPPYINSHNYPYKPISSTPPPYINSHNYPYKPVSPTPRAPVYTTTRPAITTKKCSRGKTAITEYPGQISEDTSFHKLPFAVQISHFQRASRFPEDQNYMPESGFQDPELSRFHWESGSWFPQTADQSDYQFD